MCSFSSISVLQNHTWPEAEDKNRENLHNPYRTIMEEFDENNRKSLKVRALLPLHLPPANLPASRSTSSKNDSAHFLDLVFRNQKGRRRKGRQKG